MTNDYSADLGRLESIAQEIRRIRERTCEPKRNSNARYHALSSAVSSLDKAIADMRAEGG
jgi:hypothetical protein